MADNVNPKKPGDGDGSMTSSLVKAESVLQLAMAVPVGCCVGLAAGWWLDKKLHTHWIVIAGMLLGAAGGFVQIFTYVARMSASNKSGTDE